MRTWKIVVLGTVLSAGSIVAITHHASNGLEHSKTIVDQTTNSRQQIQQISTVAHPVALLEKTDTSKASDTEPWGPFRSVDW
jgi:hypothetical protein